MQLTMFTDDALGIELLKGLKRETFDTNDLPKMKKQLETERDLLIKKHLGPKFVQFQQNERDLQTVKSSIASLRQNAQGGPLTEPDTMKLAELEEIRDILIPHVQRCAPIYVQLNTTVSRLNKLIATADQLIEKYLPTTRSSNNVVNIKEANSKRSCGMSCTIL